MFAAGRTTAKQERGYTPRLCPICRAIRVFAVYTIEEYAHWYLLPLTSSQRVGTLLVCPDCGARLAPRSSGRQSVHGTNDLATLWNLLSPAECRRLLEEAAAELDLLRDPRGAPRARRHEAILQPFLACETELASKLEGGQHHPISFFPVAAGIGCAVAGIAIFWAGWTGMLGGPLLATMGGVLFLALAAVLFYHGSAAYLLQRTILPRLVRSLAPLSPSVSELADVLAELRIRGTWIARRVRPESLARQLQDFEPSLPVVPVLRT